MYISQVRLKDIKGFSGTRAVDLSLTRPDGSHAGWTVLAGRNGSGKTSMLRALALAVSGPAVARNLVADYENWVAAGAREARAMVSVVSDAEADVWSPQDGKPFMKTSLSLGLVWRVPRRLPDARAARRGAQPSLSPDHFTDDAAADGPWQENPIGWFCAGYGPFRRLSGGTLDQRFTQSSPQVARLGSLFHEDVALTESVAWLIDQHLRALEGRPGAEELKDTALRVLADGLLPDDYGVREIDSEGLWVAKDEYRFPLREMSDGYRTVTALVVDLLKRIYEAFGDLPCELRDGVSVVIAPGVVFIDEVDAHLHISWQKRIGSWLKTHFPNIQFIVTTHSPYICQDADPGGLIRLPGPDEEARPHKASEDLYERVVYGSGDDAVLSELFGVDSTYSDIAQHKRRELVILEVRVLSGTADEEEMRRYQRLKEELTSSGTTRVREVAAGLQQSGEADT